MDVEGGKEHGVLGVLCSERYNEAVWMHWIAYGLSKHQRSNKNSQAMNFETYYPKSGVCREHEDDYIKQVVGGGDMGGADRVGFR